MKYFSPRFLIALLLICTWATSKLLAQQDIPATADVEMDIRFSDIRANLIEMMKARKTPSVAIGVASEGKVLWLEAFGWADRKTENAATPTTIYAIGSMSKSITATATVALMTQELLDPQTRIADLIGDEGLQGLGGSFDHVRVEHLLNSTAGIPHGWISYDEGSEPLSDSHPWRRVFVCFPPGEVFEYSNNSFGILQQVIESATEQRFEQAMQKLVFNPLGMTGSMTHFDSARTEEFATPYDRSGSPIPRRRSTPEAGLGLFSTARDLLYFGMYHVGTPATDQESPLSDHWLGWMHTPRAGPSRFFFHLGWWSAGRGVNVSNGSIAGANANLTIIPDEKLVVVVLTNQTSSLADELCGQIIASFVPAFAEAGRESHTEYHRRFRTPYQADSDQLGTWEGKLLTPDAEVPLKVILKAERVIVQINQGDPVPLENPSLNEFGELRGSLSGRIPRLSPQGEDQHQIKLMLRMRDEILSGYISAIFRTQSGGFSIPAYVELQPVSN